MSEIADKILAQFDVSGIPSLPELLLGELDELQKTGRAAGGGGISGESLAENDLFLFARLIAGSPGHRGKKHFQPAKLINSVGMDKVSALIRQSATRMSFERMPATRLRFLKQLYIQSMLARSLAEQLTRVLYSDAPERESMVQQAAFCGQFLNVGALVLEQVYPEQYIGLLQQAGEGKTLLELEISEFGIDHAELGAALLKKWHVEGFCQDAVRYHHFEVSEILDAVPLVKIAWLANQLADAKENPEAPVWADTLFELGHETLEGIRASAQGRLDEKSRILGIHFSTTRYLPLPAKEDEEIILQEKRALRQLRYRVEAEHLFATVSAELANTTGPVQLGRAIGSAVRQLFGPYEGLLFALDDGAVNLEYKAGTLRESGLNQLRIRYEAERSILADSGLAREPVFRLPGQGLSVIDQQLLTLLETDNFCCQPIVEPLAGKVCGMLVLGIPVHQADGFKKQRFLRNALARELGAILAERPSDEPSQEDALAARYDRKIRETIHEVNNPLGIIKNYLQLLSMKQADDRKTQSEISFIKSEIDRVGDILQRLTDLPGSPAGEEAVAINAVVTSLVNVVRGSIDNADSITLETRLDPTLPETRCSEYAIRQILTNLVKNSAEALEEGGTITVKTAGNVYMNGNRYIQLTVTDNGPGIAADILDNLFAPGNSSKGGGHSGSGLSIIKGLVDELGGQISCQTTRTDNNNEATGTEFIVLVPVSEQTSSGDTV